MISYKILRMQSGSGWVPYFSIAVTTLLVCAIGLFGIVQDMRAIRSNVFRNEISKAKSHADRTVGRIELDLLEGVSLESYRLEADPRWLVDHWRRTIPSRPERLYAAISNGSREILAHSDDLGHDVEKSEETELDTTQPGDRSVRQLEELWDNKPLSDYGDSVFEIEEVSLSKNVKAIDIGSPISYQGDVIGTYHTGLESLWLEDLVWQAQQRSIRGWGLVFGTIGMIVLFSSILLFRLGLHTRRLELALDQAETRRLADVSRLIVGMAHEMRNPLNAVRLNLFTSEKLLAGQAEMPHEEAITMVQESVREVERIDELIGQLLGYARADIRRQGECQVDAEISSVLQFLKQVHERHGIQLRYERIHGDLWIRLDAKHFRQVLLNVLSNAREAIGEQGTIEVNVTNESGCAVIRVEDSGPGVASDQYDRIFEPFYSTRDDGVGMGLAVVNSLVESAGGSVACQRSWHLGGMNFVISVPVFNRSSPT
jgi:two-component system sensor histidine kinase HydH